MRKIEDLLRAAADHIGCDPGLTRELIDAADQLEAYGDEPTIVQITIAPMTHSLLGLSSDGAVYICSTGDTRSWSPLIPPLGDRGES